MPIRRRPKRGIHPGWLLTVVALRVVDLAALGIGGRLLVASSCAIDCLENAIANWDAHWYTSIAMHGYDYSTGVDSNVAFFPGFPLAIRVLTFLVGSPLWAALVVSLVAGLVAVALTGRLVANDFDSATGIRASILLAAFPTAFFFALPYADGLLLAFVAGSFLGARRQRWITAIVLAGAASAVRVTGALAVLPVAWELAASHGWEPKRFWRKALLLPLGVWGIAAWAGWLWFRFGEPLAFAKAQLAGWPHAATWVLEPVRYTFVQLMQPAGYLSGFRPDLYLAYALDLSLLCISVGLFFVTRKVMPGSYLLWAITGIAFLLTTGTTNSFGRYALIVFPIFAAGAYVLRTSRRFWPVVSVGAAIQIVLAVLFGAGWWVG